MAWALRLMAPITSQNSLLVHPFAGLPDRVCMGRRRGSNSRQAQQALLPDLNNKEEKQFFTQHGCRYDMHRYWWEANCSNKLHLHSCAVASVNAVDSNTLKCRVCSHSLKKRPSHHVKRLYRILGSMQLRFATEVLIFPSWMDCTEDGFKISKHPVDVMLADAPLLIEVDGSQHFCEDYQQQGWEEQAERDDVVDAACLEINFSCLRLHYQDSDAAWEKAIRACFNLCKASPAAFVQYTPMYDKPSLP